MIDVFKVKFTKNNRAEKRQTNLTAKKSKVKQIFSRLLRTNMSSSEDEHGGGRAHGMGAQKVRESNLKIKPEGPTLPLPNA